MTDYNDNFECYVCECNYKGDDLTICIFCLYGDVCESCIVECIKCKRDVCFNCVKECEKCFKKICPDCSCCIKKTITLSPIVFTCKK